jgi:hypothetical protein
VAWARLTYNLRDVAMRFPSWPGLSRPSVTADTASWPAQGRP